MSALVAGNCFYDPATDRFTQEDPIGLAGGLNLYGYANGDPVNFSDPFGLCPWCATALGGAAIFGGVRLTYNLLNDRPWSEGLIEDMVVGGVMGATLGAATPALVAKGGHLAAHAAQASGAAAAGAGAAARAGVDANKLNHIFGKASHNLAGAVQDFGGSTTRTYGAMQQAINQRVAANDITGRFQEVVRVGSQDITIRGSVIDGVAKISTAFIERR